MDSVSKLRRSEIMATVRSRGNRSTEWKIRAILIQSGIRGWRLHYQGLSGRPDFTFIREKIAIFVDGCFWHGCPKCGRIPKSNPDFWRTKILRNTVRDRRCRAQLRSSGWRVLRLWEHDLQNPNWVLRFRDLLNAAIRKARRRPVHSMSQSKQRQSNCP
jgi:DNA mismatch endonuclease (patch repair protein)